MKRTIEVHGHRGARGLMPENTISAFLKALELGVTILELDLAVSKDHELVISHEPYMNSQIALDSLGHERTIDEEQNHNLYHMSYAQIEQYDVGSKYHDGFPNQKKIKVEKPLFSSLVTAVQQYAEEHNIPNIKYNIEIKSSPDGDDLFHPKPAIYAKLVFEFIASCLNKSQVSIQSFDFRILQYFRQYYSNIELAILIENEETIDDNLNRLGFQPEIYSCYFELMDQDKVAYLQSLGMKVIPWTVNDQKDIKKVLSWGVDGIISDFPDRVIEEISK